MNNLIRVEDAKLYLAKNYIDGKKSLGQCLDETPTVNVIEILDGATNGDVIKALFPNFTFRTTNNELRITRSFDLYSEEHLEIAGMASAYWWNAPYKAEIVVSNPPFSKRDSIFQQLYEWDIPFALIINFNGLFDSKKRADIFRQHNVEMLVPRGRMKFCHKDKGMLNSPNFQSIYVCNRLLDRQIVFDETTF